jgi:hypothetical protein
MWDENERSRFAAEWRVRVCCATSVGGVCWSMPRMHRRSWEVWQVSSSSSPRKWPCGPVVQTSLRDGMGMPSLPLVFSPFSCAASRISARDLIVVPPVAWQQIGDLPAEIQFVQRRSLASTDSLLRPFASLLQGRSGRTASRAAIFLADLLKSPDPLPKFCNQRKFVCFSILEIRARPAEFHR